MDDDKNPLLILAYGLAIGLGLVGLGLALKWVIPAIGAAIGVATSIIAGGLVTSTLNSWVIPAASVGLAIGGGATGVILLAKVVKGAKKNPYEWTLPILAIISGLVIDTCKELYQTDNGMMRMIYGASVTGLFLLGGILWRQKKVKFKFLGSKIISIIIFLVPPFLIYLRYSQINKKSFFEAYKDIPSHIIWSIVALLVFLLLITFLSWIFQDENDDR